MKNALIGILLATTLLFGGMSIYQGQQTSRAEARVAALRRQIRDLDATMAQEKKRVASLKDQLQQSQADAAANASQTIPSVQATTGQPQASVSSNAKADNLLSEMFKKPELKEMIKTQQKTVFSTMIDKNYAKLIADLQLTPEQATALRDLVMKKTLVDIDTGMSVMSGDMDTAKREELMQQAKTDKDAINGQIKQLLGDDNYTQFQAYEKTQPERMTISTFKDQLASGPNALTSDQEEQLIQAMSAERTNFKFTTDLSDKSKFTGDFASMFTEDKINQFQQELGQLDQHYVTRAQSILTPDQAAAFDKFLASQRQMQQLGMQMAAKMFAPKAPSK
jgi:hypothetical protein